MMNIESKNVFGKHLYSKLDYSTLLCYNPITEELNQFTFHILPLASLLL